MGAQELERLGFHCRALRGVQALVEVKIARRPVAPDQLAPGQPGPLADRRRQRLGRQRRIDPRRRRDAIFPIALGQIVAAMVGGQHDHIVDPVAVEPIEE